MSSLKVEKKEKKEKSGKRSKNIEHPAPVAVGSENDDEEDFEANKQRIEELCRVLPNNICADCNATGTRWASVSLGVFFCIRCSGLHRALGVHISMVKSTNMDSWTTAEIGMMEAIGNKRGKEIYEASLPRAHKPLTGSESDSVVSAFIQKKYVEKAFATPGIDEILKKIGKRTGYTRKGGKKPSKSSGKAPAAVLGGETATDAASAKKLTHSDPMKDLFGDKSALAQQQAAKKKEKKVKPIDGVFGLCTVASDEHDEKRQRVFELFSVAQ